MAAGADPESLTDVFDQLLDGTDGDKVTLGDVMDVFGQRTFGPMLLVPGLLAISPAGAIPGVPTTLAVLILLIAGQLVFGVDHPWLPARLLSISFSRDRLEKGIRKGRPWAERVDRILEHRLTHLTQTPILQLIALVCMLVAASMPPLELVPFAVFVPGFAVVAFGLGLTARDGYLIIGAFILTAATLGLVGYALTNVL